MSSDKQQADLGSVTMIQSLKLRDLADEFATLAELPPGPARTRALGELADDELAEGSAAIAAVLRAFLRWVEAPVVGDSRRPRPDAGRLGGAMTTDGAVERLDHIPNDDPEHAHIDADKVLLEMVPSDVKEAYLRLVRRCAWWAHA